MDSDGQGHAKAWGELSDREKVSDMSAAAAAAAAASLAFCAAGCVRVSHPRWQAGNIFGVSYPNGSLAWVLSLCPLARSLSLSGLSTS
eukprot:COSAG02_NODE_304_length_25204_cov_11.025095_14_plen_88_part_00